MSAKAGTLNHIAKLDSAIVSVQTLRSQLQKVDSSFPELPAYLLSVVDDLRTRRTELTNSLGTEEKRESHQTNFGLSFSDTPKHPHE
jgi:hypothetical protein